MLVANPDSGIKQLKKTDVINIYLGRYRRLESGLTAEPIDLADDLNSKQKFYSMLVGKNLAEINAYWSRLVFSGKTRPPQEVENVENAIRLVAGRLGVIAYIDRKYVDSRVIIVFELSE